MNDLKQKVQAHWEKDVCGSRYGKDGEEDGVDLNKMAEERYRLEPYIPEFAGFSSSRGKRVLEIGVGGGADFSSWLANGAHAVGIDLTAAGIELTRQRLDVLGYPRLSYELYQGDAENLNFPDESFDIVYSYGVLHHTPDTSQAFGEVYRVLKKGGECRAMVYHVPSITGWLLWVRYSLLTGKIFKTPRQAIFEQMESPGTKAYTKAEMEALLRAQGFVDICVYPKLVFSDLLLNKRSEKYRSSIYAFIWKLYPRWLIRWLGDRYGFFLFINARK